MRALAALFLTLACATAAQAQDKDFNLNLHAHDDASPAVIGLPAYPGATPYKENDNSGSADLGFTLNAFHIGLKLAEFQTADAQSKVASFYRKALAKYGDVLECRNGEPAGALKKTSSGLTCRDNKDGNEHGSLNVNGSSADGFQLRAGFPHDFRVMAFDDKQGAQTRFVLIHIELPRDSGKD